MVFCKGCDGESEVEPVEDSDGMVMCLTCGEEFQAPKVNSEQERKYKNYKVAYVMEVQAVPGKKDLKLCIINVGDVKKHLQVVTNAKHIDVADIVVVALEGAVVPAGANPEEDADAIVVSKTSVGGVKSEGMLCDSPMLGWTGGAKGLVQKLKVEEFPVGSLPPLQRPGAKK